jgi:hypothetical protein
MHARRADNFRERVSFPYYCHTLDVFWGVVLGENKIKGYKKRYKQESNKTVT